VIIGDARLSGIPILPVDVNASGADWQVEHAVRLAEPRLAPGGPAEPREGLRIGLRQVKGISDAEVTRMIAGRPYASLRDFWERARVSRPVVERLVLVGALDSLYAGRGTRLTRRDLLARVGVLAGPSRPARNLASSQASPALSPGGPTERGPAQLTLDLGDGSRHTGDREDGIARIVPAGELPELSAAERVEAELEILGIDASQHVISFYAEMLSELGVVRARDLHRCRPGATVLVAGVKTATQTPAIRSGQRIIFVTLDDATGAVNLAFFESVQERCAARVFGSWLLVVRGRVRKPGPQDTPVSINATECWDLAVMEEIRVGHGIGAVRAAMAAGDVPGPGVAAATRLAALGLWPAPDRGEPVSGRQGTAGKIIYGNGFTLSPYAETGSPGSPVKDPPRRLWHASPGSPGGRSAEPGNAR
jgi:error-prone DNA polymerase